jgi:hypothetical protein
MREPARLACHEDRGLTGRGQLTPLVRPVHHGRIGTLDAGGAAVRVAGTHGGELALKAVRMQLLRTSQRIEDHLY